MHKLIKSGLLFVPSVLLAVEMFTITRAQEPTSAPDRFVGVWKLDLEKHPRSGIKSETLKIEKRVSDYKFIYDWIGDKRDETHWSAVTDMKGEVVKRVQPNGKTFGPVRITRIDTNNFVEQDDLIESKYQVAEDGKTMTMVMKYLHTGGNTAIPKIELVYERAE
jgi:hypothetical protein